MRCIALLAGFGIAVMLASSAFAQQPQAPQMQIPQQMQQQGLAGNAGQRQQQGQPSQEELQRMGAGKVNPADPDQHQEQNPAVTVHTPNPPPQAR